VRPLRWRGTWAKPQFPGNHGLYIVFLSPEQEWLSGLSNIENDLADMSSLLHSFMRAPGIFQRKDHVHHGSHAALRQKRPDLCLQFPRNASLEIDGPRTQRGAGMGQTLGHQQREIGCGFRTIEKSNLHDAAIFGSRLVIAVNIITADHIENHIDALAFGLFLHDLYKVL